MRAYQLTLHELLEERRCRNPAYSLRSFARACGVSPASLSQILSGKRPLTLQSARRIAENLAFAPDERDSFIGSATPRRDRELEELGPRERLSVERFRLVADWYHYGILSLAELRSAQADPLWISDKLGISRAEAEAGLQRVVELGLLAVKRGRMKRTSSPLVSTYDVPSSALRKHHRQILDRATQALETIPMEWREMGAMTMVLDPRKLPQAKRLIRRFRQQLASLCESGEPELVYHFCTFLFPVNAPEKFCDPEEYRNAITVVE